MSDHLTNIFPVEAEKNYVEFNWIAAKNNAASTKEGRPIYDKVLELKIRCPGQKNGIQPYEVERHLGDGTVVVNKEMFRRFGVQIEKFKANERGPDISGTPLDQLTGLDVHQIAMLKGVSIYTVEGLAAVEDGALRHIGMGARALRSRAQAYLQAAEGQAPVSRLAAENEKLSSEVEMLREQVKELAAMVEKQGDDAQPQRRGPGRPRKTEQEAA